MPIEYEDLEVEVSRGISRRDEGTRSNNGFEVRILESPYDRPREPFTLPYSAEQLEIFLKAWEDLFLNQGAAAARQREELAKTMGQRLYASLFHGRVGKTFDQCFAGFDAERRHRDVGLRVRVSFGERDDYQPEVLGLPWEFLWSETTSFLGCGPTIQVVRYLDTPRRILPLETEPPLKVLAVFCSPTDQPEVELKEERRRLQEAVVQQSNVEIRVLEHATLAGLRERLLKYPAHVLHFLGHGNFRKGTGEGILFFEKDDHTSDVVTGGELAEQLKGINSLRLVVLNACSGAKMLRHRGQHPFTGTASALIAGGLPAVVAMQFPISVEAASTFSTTFYKRIAESFPVDEAVSEARLRIRALDEIPSSFEWATPVLFLRARDGRILHLKKDGPVAAKRIALFHIEDIGKKAIEMADYHIDLTPYFENRFIRKPELWNSLLIERLDTEIDKVFEAGHAYHLDLAAPMSVAFATGYLVQVKEGIKMVLTQRGLRETSTWSLDDPIPQNADSWKRTGALPKDFPLTADSRDVALVIEVSNPVLPAVAKYLRRADLKPPKIGHLIYPSPRRGASQAAVQGGAHAFQLAEALANRVHRYLSAHDTGTLHIFGSAPNALIFFLGRLSRKFPRIQLYEHDFEGERELIYMPSITLPPGTRGRA